MKRKNKITEKIKNFLTAYSKWVPPKIFIVMLIAIFTLMVSLSLFKLDNDFWFLINTGKYILNNGFPTIEPFTIHSNLEFIAQQWLTDIIFYLIYNKLGIYGIVILMNIINIIIILLIYKICLMLTNNKIKISIIITIIIDFLLCISFITTRPQLFDAVLLLTELYLLELYIAKDKKTYLIGLPIISLLMINLHSSLWLMIFVFLLPYYAELIINYKKEKNKLKTLIPVTIIMLLVGLINPYGIEGIKYLFNSYGVDLINKLVGEMNPITVPDQLIIYIYIFITLLSYYFNKGNNKLRYLLFTLGTGYLALSHFKGVLFFIISSILSLSYNFKDTFKEKNIQPKYYKSNKLNKFIICFIIIYTLGLYTYSFKNSDVEEKTTPHLIEIANYLDKNTNKNIKLYTNYEDGGYLEYRGYKCYLDARAEVFIKRNNKKEDILLEYYNIQTGKYEYKEFLDKYNFDYLIINSDDILYYQLKESNYEIVYEKELERTFDKKILSYRIYKKVNQ